MAKRFTPFGIEVKKKLLDMGITQKEFCRQNNIPETRFSEILTGTRVIKKYQTLIADILNIKMPA